MWLMAIHKLLLLRVSTVMPAPASMLTNCSCKSLESARATGLKISYSH